MARDLKSRRGQATHEVKGQEAGAPEPLLDLRAEHPEIEQVAQQVNQPAVEKHRTDWRQPNDLSRGTRVGDLAEEFSGNQSPGCNELTHSSAIRSGSAGQDHLVDKNNRIDGDQRTDRNRNPERPSIFEFANHRIRAYPHDWG